MQNDNVVEVGTPKDVAVDTEKMVYRTSDLIFLLREQSSSEVWEPVVGTFSRLCPDRSRVASVS